MNKFDFLGMFYNQVSDSQSLLSGLNSILGSEPHQVTIVPFASELTPEESFKADNQKRIFNFSELDTDTKKFDLSYTVFSRSIDARQIISGSFFVLRHSISPQIFLAITLEESDFVRKALLPFIEQNRHRFYLTFIRHEYLRGLLSDLRQKQSYSDLRVIRASTVSRFSAGKHETMIPSVSWPNLGLDGAFDYAEEQNAWFRSLTFEGVRDSRIITEINIQRDGIVRTSGDFKGVYENLVTPVCQQIKDNVRMFNKRSRKESQYLNIRPLMVRFDKEQFTSIDDNSRFIDAIRKMNNASVSVLHGNPYVNLSVVDYSDGSTFDLWVLNSQEVIIIPQLASSILGIKRLIKCLFDNYAEGAISDYDQLRN